MGTYSGLFHDRCEVFKRIFNLLMLNGFCDLSGFADDVVEFFFCASTEHSDTLPV